MLSAAAMFAVAFVFLRYVLGRVKWKPVPPPTGQPVPAGWSSILARRVPLVSGLTDDERERLLQLMYVFVTSKHWEGCNGLRLTEDMQVTVAAYACLLLLNAESHLYPRLKTILLYPGTFVPERVEWGDGEFVDLTDEPTLGESWAQGIVILSWDDVTAAGRSPSDGTNVTLHEFAHQLDQEDMRADGMPAFLSSSRSEAWSDLIEAELEALRRASDAGRSTVLDPYGAEDPAELFAVATEAFFETPVRMRRKHPELYDELKRFYRQDPAERAFTPRRR